MIDLPSIAYQSFFYQKIKPNEIALIARPAYHHSSLKIPGTHNSFTNNLYPDLGIGPDRHRVLKWLCARGLGCIVKPLVFKWCQCQRCVNA